MSKNKAAAHSYDHVTPQLIKRVETVLAEAVNHKYSVSRIYATHNEVFKKRDQPQTCSSCLRNRVRDLKAWFNGMPEDKKLRPATPDVPDTPEVEPIGSVYDRLVNRLALTPWDGDAAAELATLNTVIGADYSAHLASIGQPELSEAEIDAVLTRMGELEELVKDDAAPQYNDPAAPGFVAPAPSATRIPMKGDVLPFDFTTEDGTPAKPGSKGAVKNADGTPVKPGTYTTADGHEIAIQVGGRATFKMQEEDLT